jgi:hypothetical protein
MFVRKMMWGFKTEILQSNNCLVFNTIRREESELKKTEELWMPNRRPDNRIKLR